MGVWYNNGTAFSSEIYPRGLSKYYDLYSWNGMLPFILDLLFSFISFPLSLFTFLPLPIWIAIFNGKKWDNIFNVFFIPFGIGGLFSVVLEQGLLMN